MSKINPFQPNSPVNPGMFVGRSHELSKLKSALVQTRAGLPKHFMIVGERGIGKTSLQTYLRHLAQGRIPANGDKFRFLVVETEIDRSTTKLGLIGKIQRGLEREVRNIEKAKAFFKDAWDFLRQFEVGGAKFNPQDKSVDEESLQDEFAYSLAETVNRVVSRGAEEAGSTSKHDGLLILIDEADNAKSELDLGAFLKLLNERLEKRDCKNVLIGLAGLPELRNVLLSSHESSLRMFDEISLGRLDDSEVVSVVDICLSHGKELNGQETAIEEKALSILTNLAEGFPHFIQQFGYSAFEEDEDSRINERDVLLGAFRPGGAIEEIGNRYYKSDFYTKIQGEGYRDVLRIMAEYGDDWVSKKQIAEKFEGTQATLNNALKALRDRRIILDKEGEPGKYRLQHKGFALWIKTFASKPTDSKLAKLAKTK